MKNYFNLSEIPSIAKIKNKLIEYANEDIRQYLKELPITEKTKLDVIRDKDFIKMYYVPIRYTQAKGLPERNMDEVFNISVDSVEQNHENGSGLRAREIEELVDMNYYSVTTPFFQNTLSLIPTFAHSSWIIFYKQGAIVHPHDHDDTTILTHILLEDITEGEFVVDVKGEKKVLTKKGDFFIFCGGNTHSALFTGQEAKFITISIEYNNINDLIVQF